ncbi:Outer membrane protein assembly factor YaeT precursor [hydrothermal vent metagenome]|uniref:Outer membrane protein assembly factor YaeT n=1 Tax=hydrothermal vent metagenome TaxID=652676 RepID=A0A1W1EBU9_9ZZZZ
MNNIIKTLALSAVASSVVMAGGYKIPEQSLNSMALGAAYVAHTTHADTSYFNPANMVFMGEKQYIEGGVTLAHLPSQNFASMADSETENILMPNFHYVSAPMGDWRWGVSLTAPGGLTKRWDDKLGIGKAFAEEFTLKAVELNPTISYKVMDNFSIGGGVRIIYSEGIVKSDSSRLSSNTHPPADPVPVSSRDMEGDTVEFGYNLAATYKPTSDIIMAVTYRSNVDLNEEGTAVIKYNGNTIFDGDATVSVPLPAALNLAISKTWDSTFTLELNYERTYWSSYKDLNFGYTGAGSENIPLPFKHNEKNWKDTNTFRIGATVELDKITMMMGFAIDETPVPDETLGFEMADSDAKIFTMGFRYQQTEDLSWGMAFLYDSKDPRSIDAGVNPIFARGASFNGGGAMLTTIGMAYEF